MDEENDVIQACSELIQATVTVKQYGYYTRPFDASKNYTNVEDLKRKMGKVMSAIDALDGYLKVVERLHNA